MVLLLNSLVAVPVADYVSHGSAGLAFYAVHEAEIREAESNSTGRARPSYLICASEIVELLCSYTSRRQAADVELDVVESLLRFLRVLVNLPRR